MAGANRHMAAFARHHDCPAAAMSYRDGGATCERDAGGCGARWAVDVSVHGHRFVPAVHPGLVDAR